MKVKRRNQLKKTGKSERRIAFQRLRKILPTSVFLPLDGLLCAASGDFYLDVFRLEKQIPDYNSNKCTFKGKPNYSMKMAIVESWGQEAAKLIEILL